MEEVTAPADLTAAIATQPAWIQGWVMVLVVVNLAALLFVVKREEGRFSVRVEPIAVVAAFFLAAVLMNWLYVQFGYVRLLGLGHLVFWTPVWAWIFARRAAIGTASVWGKYAHVYLVIAGISLVIDVVDVVRYLAGDAEPL